MGDGRYGDVEHCGFHRQPNCLEADGLNRLSRRMQRKSPVRWCTGLLNLTLQARLATALTSALTIALGRTLPRAITFSSAALAQLSHLIAGYLTVTVGIDFGKVFH